MSQLMDALHGGDNPLFPSRVEAVKGTTATAKKPKTTKLKITTAKKPKTNKLKITMDITIDGYGQLGALQFDFRSFEKGPVLKKQMLMIRPQVTALVLRCLDIALQIRYEALQKGTECRRTIQK